MYPTTEIRWFYKGTMPEEVVHWYHAHAGTPEKKTPRKDQYLYITGYHTLGIKIREGNIEIKAQTNASRLITVTENMYGYAANWRKWSFLLGEENPPIDRLMAPSSSWTEVYKQRSLMRYQITTDKIVKPISSLQPCLTGCDVELTGISIGQDSWWSLCFEAFGPERENNHNLDIMLNEFFHSKPPFAFKSQDSFSYPELIEKYCQQAL